MCELALAASALMKWTEGRVEEGARGGLRGHSRRRRRRQEAGSRSRGCFHVSAGSRNCTRAPAVDVLATSRYLTCSPDAGVEFLRGPASSLARAQAGNLGSEDGKGVPIGGNLSHGHV